MDSANPHYRSLCLKRLQTCGVYILDASIIPLSGYQNRNPDWPSRVLELYEEQVMRDSWFYYSKAILDRIMLQPARPIIVLYTHVRDLLGGDLRSDVRSIALPVKFPQWGDTTYYQSSAYPYGTSQFRVAAKLAGLDRCLRNIYGKN